MNFEGVPWWVSGSSCVLCVVFLVSAWDSWFQILGSRKNSLPLLVHATTQLHQGNPRLSLLKL